MKTIEFKIDQMFRMPTGEVLKIKELNPESNFSCRLFGLNKEWTDYYIHGAVDRLHLFFTEGKAEFVKNDDYPMEPVKETKRRMVGNEI